MHGLRWFAAVWPGLFEAWLLGSPRALGLAVAFAAALNLALVTTLVWPRWPLGAPPALAGSAAWVLVLGLWVWGIVRLRGQWKALFPPARNDPQIEDWFGQAQQAYLRGHWLEAESLVNAILQRRPGDVESRLLRASIERRTKRYAEARKTLNELLPAGVAGRWRTEVGVELEQIAAAQRESASGAAAKAA